jgi:hypothetical protein
MSSLGGQQSIVAQEAWKWCIQSHEKNPFRDLWLLICSSTHCPVLWTQKKLSSNVSCVVYSLLCAAAASQMMLKVNPAIPTINCNMIILN